MPGPENGIHSKTQDGFRALKQDSKKKKTIKRKFLHKAGLFHTCICGEGTDIPLPWRSFDPYVNYLHH